MDRIYLLIGLVPCYPFRHLPAFVNRGGNVVPPRGDATDNQTNTTNRTSKHPNQTKPNQTRPTYIKPNQTEQKKKHITSTRSSRRSYHTSVVAQTGHIGRPGKMLPSAMSFLPSSTASWVHFGNSGGISLSCPSEEMRQKIQKNETTNQTKPKPNHRNTKIRLAADQETKKYSRYLLKNETEAGEHAKNKK